MTDLLLSTPDEFRAVASAHAYRNLDTIRGYLVDSQNTFLRQRLGQPLIKAMLQQYTDIKPIVGVPTDQDYTNYEDLEQPWPRLIQLAQRCIAYDALYRSAGIRRVSDNDMGINVAESDNYAAVDKDRFEAYRIDLYKGAHTASDMLLTQLQDWEHLYEQFQATQSDQSSPSPLDPAIPTIITLWRQSPTYPLTDGLLFTTAVEFNTYVNIQTSLDRFIEILPDIRYCQELHIEAEIGTDLLLDLHRKHRAGTLSPVERSAYQKLQRTLSLYVEARSPLFKRQDARDEAAGYMRITRDFITVHQIHFDRAAMSRSPLFVPPMWPKFDAEGNPLAPDGTILTYPDGTPACPDFDAHGHPHYPEIGPDGHAIPGTIRDPHRAPHHPRDPRHPHLIDPHPHHDHIHGRDPHCDYDHRHDRHDPYRDLRDPDRPGFLETSLI